MLMLRVIRGLAVFAALYLLSAGLFLFLIPQLSQWHLHSCASLPVSPIKCKIGADILSYWWIALLPVLLALSIAIEWLLSRRAAASIGQDRNPGV